MNEMDFQACAFSYMTKLVDFLETHYPHLDVEDTEEAIVVELSDHRQFLINVHLTSKQIWLSSPLSGAHHYSYDVNSKEWIDTRASCCLMLQLKSELERVA